MNYILDYGNLDVLKFIQTTIIINNYIIKIDINIIIFFNYLKIIFTYI